MTLERNDYINLMLIDQTDGEKDFTFDPVRFPPKQVQEFVYWLHSRNQKYALMCDPALDILPGYKPYDDLMQR